MYTNKTVGQYSNTEQNANESSKKTSSEKQVNEQIKDSPIWIRGNDESGYFATLGDYRITDENKDYDQVMEEVMMPDMPMICRIITVMIDSNERFKQVHPDAYTTKD